VRASFLASHRFIVLIVAGVFLLGTHTWSVQRAEALFYDLGMYLMPGGTASSSVAVVAIDKEAISRIGPWPWPRDNIARTIDRLRRLDARAIGLMLPLDETQTPPSLESLLESASSSKRLAATGKKWATRLDTDRRLARAISVAGNVVVAADYGETSVLRPLSQPLRDEALKGGELSGWRLSDLLRPLTAGPGRPLVSVAAPIELLAEAAAAVGLVEGMGGGGPRRGMALALPADGKTLPALVTALAALSQGAAGTKLVLGPGGAISAGEKVFPGGPDLLYYPLVPRAAKGRSPVPVYSAGALWDDGPLEKQLRGKTVLIGLTDPALAPVVHGPRGTELTPVTWSAIVLAGLLEDSHVTVPPWFYAFQRFLILVLAAYLWLAPERLHGRAGLLIALLAAAVLLNIDLVLLLARQLWLPLAVPALFVLVTSGALWLRRSLMLWGARGYEEAAEVRRALGGSLSAQGRLDEAFEQFRLCPQDGAVLEPLYRLGLEFERRRQPEQARAVYGYAGSTDSQYRDIPERMQRLETAFGGVGVPAAAAGNAAMTRVLEDPGLEKPTLAHYRLERELGRGAMAVVYLATDSKLGRAVAIKALSLSEEFEGDALEEAEQRFAREAEAAARLSHPNIVTVYETGNDHGLAYIAMDYAGGESLEEYTPPENLLPVSEVLDVGAQVAEALDYAHQRDVVHRDIKPSNIIYDRARSTVKVTDFGIARLTDDSRTRTGIVMGTPLYMSPEQAVGERVDGRSDLFSLAVTLYQLLTGRPPFVGDSVANLMYRIATVRPQAVRRIRPEIPANLSRLINRGLEKDPGERFPTGEDMAEALLRCRGRLTGERRRAVGTPG